MSIESPGSRSPATIAKPSAIPSIVPALDAQRLQRALADADLRVLLMCLFHISGDERWLSPRYQPGRDVRLIADEDAGLAADVQAEIRVAALELMVSRAGSAPAIGDPGDDLMLRMMRVCMGENIAPAYAPMMREELGLRSRDVAWSVPPAAERLQQFHQLQPLRNAQVLIVGAGASGLILGARLLRLGVPFTIVERRSEVGGTWLDNRYPGCGVDTPNHAYSFSIGERYRWSSYFSPRDDILSYLRGSADAFGVRSKIRFNTTVIAAQWDQASAQWQVSVDTAQGQQQITANALVSAIGQFGLPNMPHIKGAADFAGASFHTSSWPEDIDLSGKRVAIIGTGASAMQIVPAIADKVTQLSIYQRSPQWARPIPRYHDSLSEDAQWLLEKLPFYAAWFRFSMLWRYGDGLLPFLKKDPSWPHPQRSLNRVNDNHRQQMLDHIVAELGDRTDLLAKCVPDYPPYGKRILLDNGWYRAIQRTNVELITDAIDHIASDGVVCVDGTHRSAEVLVWSTGFQMTQMTARLGVIGRDGRKLADVWGDDNASAHLGITVPGFPNMFIMQGPNTGLGHGGSAIFQAECQARYISGCVVKMIEQGIAAMDVRQPVHDDFVARVDALHAQMIWTHPGVSTYYRNRHGRVVSATPFSLLEYWAMTHEVDLTEYALY